MRLQDLFGQFADYSDQGTVFIF